MGSIDNYGAVVTATLVDPRVTPPTSVKLTKMRLLAGSNGTWPVPVTKAAKVTVLLVSTVTIANDSGVGGLTQALVAGSVWQSARCNARFRPLSSTVAVSVPGAPMLMAPLEHDIQTTVYRARHCAEQPGKKDGHQKWMNHREEQRRYGNDHHH